MKKNIWANQTLVFWNWNSHIFVSKKVKRKNGTKNYAFFNSKHVNVSVTLGIEKLIILREFPMNNVVILKSSLGVRLILEKPN